VIYAFLIYVHDGVNGFKTLWAIKNVSSSSVNWTDVVFGCFLSVVGICLSAAVRVRRREREKDKYHEIWSNLSVAHNKTQGRMLVVVLCGSESA
jgi:hypothetical protein